MTMIIDVVSKRGKTLDFSGEDKEAKWFRTVLKKINLVERKSFGLSASLDLQLPSYERTHLLPWHGLSSVKLIDMVARYAFSLTSLHSSCYQLTHCSHGLHFLMRCTFIVVVETGPLFAL